MPVVSRPYGELLSWPGRGEVAATERRHLQEFVAKAHAEGKKVRLWGAPDTPAVWQLLLESGVDLINTDRLADLQKFLLEPR